MKNSAELQKQVGSTIIQQLGGNRFISMTGAKDFGLLPELGIHFKIGKNHRNINFVTIKFNEGLDLYEMTFEKMRISKKTWDVKRTVVSSHEQVYCDMLQSVFTSETGMYTSL